MIDLFQEGSQCRTLPFFEDNRARVTLLAAPSFLAQLYYAERKLPGWGGGGGKNGGKSGGKGFDFNVLPLDLGTFKLLALRSEQKSHQTYVVADPEGESARLAQLQEIAPNVRLVGLGRDLFPALVAQQPNAVFAPIPQKLTAHTATLVFATPRSGSSLLADILTDLGAGRVVEHLRPDVIEVLTADYDYDLPAALRNFLNFASVDGYFGTKLISLFLSNYLKGRSHLSHVARICAGLKLRVIFLDRDDKVAQAISGHLASRRGLWHITSPADAKRLQTRPKPAMEFHAVLPRYVQYQEQRGIIDAWRRMLPQGLDLGYETDLLGADLPALARRLAGFVGLPPVRVALTKTAQRQRIADDDSLSMGREFAEEFQALFGMRP